MRQHNIFLQHNQIISADADMRQFAETRIDPVNGLSFGDDRLNRIRARVNASTGLGIQLNRCAAINQTPIG